MQGTRMSTPGRAGAAIPVTPTLLRDWPLPGGGSGKDDRGSVLGVGGAREAPGAAARAGPPGGGGAGEDDGGAGLVGGAPGKPGAAALLAGTAALRAGAGR